MFSVITELTEMFANDVILNVSYYLHLAISRYSLAVCIHGPCSVQQFEFIHITDGDVNDY